MNIETLKNTLPETAKDIRLNLSTVMTEEGAPDLTQRQIFFIALASAYSIKNADIINAIIIEAGDTLDDAAINAAKSAAIIMAMNNIYYRFVHLVSDKSFATMPAKLRMNVIANPGIDKKDFELGCLAISAINGCGMCIDAHTQELTKANVSKLAVQSTVRIAAVLNAVAMGLTV